MNSTELLQALADYKADGGDIAALLSNAQPLAASAKTPLGLNRWVATDKPTMADFNEDNRIVDEKLRELGEKKADYLQQSSWTPVLTGSNVPGSHTYTQQFGRFCKIGQLIYVTFVVSISAIDTAMSGNLSIGGLPETAYGANTAGWISDCNIFVSEQPQIALTVDANSKLLSLRKMNGQSSGRLTTSDGGVKAGGITGSAVYF